MSFGKYLGARRVPLYLCDAVEALSGGESTQSQRWQGCFNLPAEWDAKRMPAVRRSG